MPTQRQRKERVYRLFTRIASAMANPHRLELLDLLVQAPRTVEELARESGMSIANTSQHLQRLKQARLVMAKREGLYMRYRLADPAVARLWLELRAVGEQQLDEVEQALDAYRTRRHEFEKVSIDELRDRLQAGKAVFDNRCAICHRADGGGLPATPSRIDGYVFPPLWGPDSFNNGAGMNRVLTAARFIKAKMPLGEADLTDDQAFDVAAYINSQPRPQMADLEKDYPDRSTKPIDGTYGPFADPFPIEQHRFGPFPPIEQHYKALKKPS